ncbi:DUF2201 family putative metallopeptidase [Vreelandella populi]|uniref:DUF2201 family putative metallopeptidase n=1 Tax=Vreelandella populi TaxID=2498858 RepID=UPI000F8C39F7|nr:hypothetical protein [Halomonas populi]RUR36646.1 hypothetical protein ELY25_13465 [Halomonas populi]
MQRDTHNQATHKRLAQHEVEKWENDRAYWEEKLPIMALLSQFFTLTPIFQNKIATASTDGRHIYFNPSYSASLSIEARRFLHAHLIWHCVAGHLTAPLVENPKHWHLACDHEVNTLLLELGIELPMDALIFPVCLGRSAFDVYRWLAGHPNTSTEITIDIHPAALWTHLADIQPSPGLPNLWRRRAHLIARESPALPDKVAKFCESR